MRTLLCIGLDLDELDVILGIDFLTKYYATLNYSNKEVLFKAGEFEIKFVGDKKMNLENMISTVKERMLISKDCNGYLAHIVDMKMAKNIPRVCQLFVNA